MNRDFEGGDAQTGGRGCLPQRHLAQLEHLNGFALPAWEPSHGLSQSLRIADPADDPETVLLKKNRGELLRRSLASLSPEHGEVIDLVYYHEKSVKETAEIVGVAEATVKTRMFYARKKLADLVVTAA